MTFASIVVIVLKVLGAIAVMMAGAAVLTWADRRQGALVQDRIGPVRAVAFVSQRAFKQQVRCGVGRQMVLLGIVVQMLVVIGKIKAGHLTRAALPN